MKNKKNVFFDRDTLLHLRLPFSFFLLPIFIFAISQSISIHALNSFIVFIAFIFLFTPQAMLTTVTWMKTKAVSAG
jgi:hypothetical protein